MKYLSLDIETFSSENLAKTGVYRYVEAPDFDILLLSYAIDGGKVQTIDLAQGESMPIDLISAILSDEVIKWAFNAQFERICISEWLKRKGYHFKWPLPFGDDPKSLNYLNPKSWRCSMVWSAYLGLPLSLEQVGSVLGLEKQKLKEGKDLIRYFSLPCNPTKTNGGRTRNLPKHDPEKWQLYKAYNKRDVETEMAIQAKLENFPMPDMEWDNYHRDQLINDLGIRIDQELARHAIRMDEEVRSQALEKLQKLTGLENPNSVIQLKDWLTEQGIATNSLDKKSVNQLLKTASGKVKIVLETRQELAKSSVKKYQAMMDCVCKDGRARGLFQFYGANRTGRFSGRLIQLQNLPRNKMDHLEEARTLVRQGELDALELLFDSVPQVLSELIRTAFVPREGSIFLVADYSAIEARVLAWLAGERWRIKLFAEGGDIYCQSASEMFGVPVVKHGVNGELRQKGKISELACGYGGSVGALKAMGALEMGLSEDELPGLVQSWRSSNPKIVRFWWDVDSAAKIAVKERRNTDVQGIGFRYQSGMLIITLPSGRELFYVKPRIGENRFGGESITYEGVGTGRRWERQETYGAKLVENIVQAISRDILCSALQTFNYSDVVMHVHDEVVIEADPRMSVEVVCRQMSRTPEWASGLKLDADGFTCNFYQKD
ncbi:MAG TPA: DNA polymerase [Bacillota bacterium]|nr:DNA polymerase [Bacillota bacterium]HQC48494.1 DNA polymerase [Bacillota bacterium]